MEPFEDKNFQDFIEKHKNDEVKTLALRYYQKVNFDLNIALQQIQGLQKSKSKLPMWYNTKNIIFPPNLNVQQSSSEQTAHYKANLLRYSSSIDLTGGFGVDSYFFAKNNAQHTYIEPNQQLFEIAQHNFEQFQFSNIICICSTTEFFLETNNQHFDCIYIDPSRRKEGKQVFLLEDYSPNVVTLQEHFFKIAPIILIKTSPILDIKNTLNTLKTVQEVHIVSVDNEVKEVLYLLNKNYTNSPKIIAVHIQKDKTDVFSFHFSEEKQQLASFSEPKNYLYEPNASILKAGGFNSIGNFYNLKKLHQNTHLYTSDTLIPFEGRVFEIIEKATFEPKILKKLTAGKANIAVRNFPYSVEEFRKKTGIKDGGNIYLFGIIDIQNKPLVLLCKKIN